MLDRLVGAGAALLAAGAALQVLGRRAGSTAEERAARLPGDDLVVHPQMVMDHAITVAAGREEVWPWLTQMGWHLGGWYTPSWVDRLLFPDNWASLDRLDPRLVRDLQVGDVVPDGRPGTAHFRVAQVESPELLVLGSVTHVPPRWAVDRGAQITWTWTIHLTALPGRATRVHLRVRERTSPAWLTGFYVATVVPSDFVMSRGMLHGLKDRAEARRAPVESGRAPLDQERYLQRDRRARA
ncbi:SRPBCC family protein [Nocardioides pinisoli]|uniref:SRPBCC family protein n=1 Tax=Nocardioides pinisoli TaxID=2950279 RepID=A0ABT1KZ28_9ACTN|nr:hypothetical protein [Nocardioides pinisoli]MCP3422273.1 hypothetical protein [Nocardioides pinisoli]